MLPVLGYVAVAERLCYFVVQFQCVRLNARNAHEQTS